MERLDFKSIVENTQDITYVLDSEGRIAYVNPIVLKVSGYTREELIGRPFSELLGPQAKTVASTFFGRRREDSSAPTRYVIELATKDGKVRTCEIHVHHFLDQTGTS